LTTPRGWIWMRTATGVAVAVVVVGAVAVVVALGRLSVADGVAVVGWVGNGVWVGR